MTEYNQNERTRLGNVVSSCISLIPFQIVCRIIYGIDLAVLAREKNLTSVRLHLRLQIM